MYIQLYMFDWLYAIYESESMDYPHNDHPIQKMSYELKWIHLW